jgi:hypothetical protein
MGGTDPAFMKHRSVMLISQLNSTPQDTEKE